MAVSVARHSTPSFNLYPPPSPSTISSPSLNSMAARSAKKVNANASRKTRSRTSAPPADSHLAPLDEHAPLRRSSRVKASDKHLPVPPVANAPVIQKKKPGWFYAPVEEATEPEEAQPLPPREAGSRVDTSLTTEKKSRVPEVQDASSPTDGIIAVIGSPDPGSVAPINASSVSPKVRNLSHLQNIY